MRPLSSQEPFIAGFSEALRARGLEVLGLVSHAFGASGVSAAPKNKLRV